MVRRLGARRNRLIAGVIVAVAIGYAGVAVAMVSSTSAANAVAWGVIICGLGVVAGLLIELTAAMGAEVPGLRVVQGQGELMLAYEGMRRTKGVSRIQAIWSARYPTLELEAYFTAEAADLRRNPEVKLERLISSDIVDDDARTLLHKNAESMPNLTVWETEPIVLECNLCEYVRDRTTFAKALVVLGGADKAAQVAILIDTRTEPAMSGVVYALKVWFESLERRPMGLSTPGPLP